MWVRVQKGEARWVLVPQPFRVPISSKKLPDSVKEMGHSTISSWAMESTCLLMQRGSDLVRAVAEQGREGMRHINSILAVYNDINDLSSVHVEKHCLIKCYSLWLYVLCHRDQKRTEIH